MTEKALYAEDLGHYWKTSQAGWDGWIEKAKREIISAGGREIKEAFGRDVGGSAFMIGFVIGADRFRIVWPVLPSRGKDQRAAQIQAATLLYHDVKARCLSAKVIGYRASFFSYIELPDGRTAMQASVSELSAGIPLLFEMNKHPALVAQN